MRKSIKIVTYIVAVSMVSGFAVLSQAQELPNNDVKQEDIAHNIETLDSFINYVWELNPVMAEADARILSARAAKDAAYKWQYNPEIEFEFEDVDGEDKTKIFGISQTIDWSGKSFSSGKAAKFELAAVEADREQVKQEIVLNVLSSLVNYKILKDIYDLAVERTSFMERFAKLAEKGFKAGDIDKSEKNLAQLALSEAYITQADIKSALSKAKGELDFAIGFELDDGFIIPDLPANLPSLPENIDEDKILASLPSLHAIKSREEAAKAMISKASKDRIPDPTIGITKGKSSGTDAIGFTISLPLNILNSYGAELEQAKSDAIAQAKLGQNEFHSAKTRLRAAISSYKLSKRAWEAWHKNGALALSQQIDILDRKFKVGDLSATDYLVQIKQALDTQVAAKELYANAWQSWFAWLGASGTVNQWLAKSKEHSGE